MRASTAHQALAGVPLAREKLADAVEHYLSAERRPGVAA